MKATNFIPKHGAVIHLTAEEADRLEEYWKVNAKKVRYYPLKAFSIQ